MSRQLISLTVKQFIRFWREQWRMLKANFQHWRFLLAWVWLRGCYLVDSPYWVSWRYQRKLGSGELHVYGETPLVTLEKIMEKAEVTAKDHVFELGAGSGFTCLWLSLVKKCRVTAVELIPTFCWRLSRTAQRFRLSGLEVRCENYLATSFQGATVIYLYGSSLADEVIKALAGVFAGLPSGVRIITVSYPLADYSAEDKFILLDQFSADFEWGKAEVFIQSIR